MTNIVLCQSCGQWFQWRDDRSGVIVKRKGYKPRYYCAECIKQNQISKERKIAK